LSLNSVFMDIIIDTDPGIDDALALFLALNSPELKIGSIVATYGNVELKQAVRNVFNILRIAYPFWPGQPNLSPLTHQIHNFPSVFQGAESPLFRPYLKKDPRIHGKNGLGNVSLPVLKFELNRGTGLEGALRRYNKDSSREKKITLICLGPLTDLARTILIDFNLIHRIKQVILMGGAATVPGNITQFAEFNIYSDPEAAKVVFNSGLPIIMVGLDVTHRTLLTVEDLKSLDTSEPRDNFIYNICRYYINFHRRYRRLGGCFLHDPLAIAVAIDRSIVKTEKLAVDVEIENQKRIGQTFIRKGAVPNVDVCLKVDLKKFMELFRTRVLEFRNFICI